MLAFWPVATKDAVEEIIGFNKMRKLECNFFVTERGKPTRIPRGVLGISSDGDDRMETKIKTQKIPRAL